MVRLMDGDMDAFQQIYDRHTPRIRGFIHRFVGDRDQADDLTQEVFLKVYRSPRSFDPRGRFVTWIYAVARNAAIDWLRLKKLKTVSIGPALDDDERVADPATPSHESPESAVLRAEMDGHIVEVTATLSPKLREVFILCALQGLSYEDAAAVIGCPVKTVSSRLSRARERFLTKFQPFLDGASPPPGSA